MAVIGLGLLGLLAAQIGRAAGCAVLGVDLRSDRLALAHRLGFQAVRPEAAEEATLALSQGRGCDAVLICADTPSNQPIELAATLARDRARVVVVGAVGLNLPRKSYYEKELTVDQRPLLWAGTLRPRLRGGRPRLSHRLCALDRRA